MTHTFLSRLGHSNAKALKVLAGGFALAAAAWGGAQWQARTASAASLDPGSLHALDQRLSRESTLIDDSIAGLAAKLGELQARLIAMDAVRQRVTDAAGLSHSAPELDQAAGDADAAPVMDDIPSDWLEGGAPGSAEVLGRRIDALRDRVSVQEDSYALIDAAMSSRAGLEASLPTLSPVDYPYLSSSFGWRRNPVSGRHGMHEGLDFVAPRGTPIQAASGGLVLRAGTVRGYGKMVEIDHGNGLSTRYAHASSLAVKPGDIVRQGQLIARVGNTGRSTGAHLHFEVRMAGYPLDPALFIGAPQGAPDLRLARSGALATEGASDATASELR
ncbi:M23 family metallopeptidase [Castellaniella sp. GW247-6E4]|uniref:M23 family metallopeptidase n=1 Tax=Castellaniella sp. GW247-6E4 TaxID=3140380 RepID=UPI003314DFC0